MASSTISSLLFLLILVFSFFMEEAVDAQTEIRKLKERMKIRRNLEGKNERSSKMWTPGSRTLHCQGQSFKDMYMKNTYHHKYNDHHLLGRDSYGSFNPFSKNNPFSKCFPFSCITCNPYSGANCYSVHCVTTRTCDEYGDCHITEECTRGSGD